MVKEISTLGSCASRNIFNSQLNKNYKEYFHINHSIEVVTLISLMSIPIKYDSNLINSDNKYSNQNVIEDLDKSFLLFLKKQEIDYLILDTYFDVLAEIIVYGENQFITNSYHLESTDFNNLLMDKERINLRRNFEQYFSLWKEACDNFFDFFNNHCKSVGLILNCNRSVSKFYDGNNIVEDDNLKNFLSLNKYRDILDRYILENYDVDVLKFDNTTLAFKDHIFGLASTHYEPKYYLDKTIQLNEIINRNDLYDEDYNKIARSLKRTQVLNEFKDI